MYSCTSQVTAALQRLLGAHTPRLRSFVTGETTLPRGLLVPRTRPSRRQEAPAGAAAALRGSVGGSSSTAPAVSAPRARAPRNGSDAGGAERRRAAAGARPGGRRGEAHSVPLDAFLQLAKGKGLAGAGGAARVSAPGQLPLRPARPPTCGRASHGARTPACPLSGTRMRLSGEQGESV